VLALIIIIFPQLITIAAKLLGISLEINLIFFIAIFILAIISFRNSVSIEKESERNNGLAQEIALLKKEVRDLKCKK